MAVNSFPVCHFPQTLDFFFLTVLKKRKRVVKGASREEKKEKKNRREKRERKGERASVWIPGMMYRGGYRKQTRNVKSTYNSN